MQKRRTIMFILLMVLGMGLLAYGLRAQAPAAPSDGQGQAVLTSEATITQAVARTEVKQDASGEVKTTAAEPPKPAEPAKPAAACPT